MKEEFLVADSWKEYELIDSGDGEKLERFGNWVVYRPEPQALWNKTLSEQQWQERADAMFKNVKASNDKGEWSVKPNMPDKWNIKYNYKDMHLNMKLSLTYFKHVGIFPEQAANWNYIYDSVKVLQKTCNEVNVLNLFAYTGGATLAAKSAGAKVTHVDAVKQIVGWAKENMEMSQLDNVRWIVEDVRKFVKREIKRGSKYQGIILDPPAFGRGADGELWKLEDDILNFLKDCEKLLDVKGFVVFNLYSMGLSSVVARTLIKSIFKAQDLAFGELFFEDKFEKQLPLGAYARFKR